ncbi:TetR/AcrR family transcriptional regulator [Agilicoccus flavus]|uniref:TetR/AcrR family transcriptional regulator n=1 Tax=Agilicoccus flavus TaxID=2775968 RepID=UPI001CF60C6D|nr:TetR/AcrR family transcriptional regulator [Agilicoccus flavus]
MSRDDGRAASPAAGRGQARTRLARAAVIGAARREFVERGYGATTVEAISAASDVPAATVYRLFSSKLGILKALLDTSIAGDDAAVPVGDRPAVRAALADPDPRRRLAGFAAVAAGINARTQPVHRVLTSAADADPAARELLADLDAQRGRGQGEVVRSLARSGALAPGVRPRAAADVVHALMSPEVYRLLVVERGWSPARYERWLAATLAAQLLADTTAAPPEGDAPDPA